MKSSTHARGTGVKAQPVGPAPRLRACVVAIAALFGSSAHALPIGANVVNGQASVAQQGGILTVTNSNGAIINWRGFSIGAGETARFVQPSSASRVLNRVVGNDPSTILGSLQSNGSVFLINPAGVMVGQGARIDVAGFVASTLNLRNEDFLARRLNFEATPGAGLVRNEGVITTPQGGQVYLIGSRVENAGTIVAPGGDVALAAGRTVQIGDTASPGVKITVAGDESATNIGRIVADAGRIGIVAALVRNSGTLNASSAVAEGGRILLKASGDTVVEGDARIIATGGTKGGQVEILGNRVAVTDRASIDVSGATGGGTALVGGDAHGAGADVQNAQIAWLGPQASIAADALQSGDGGKVVVWSDDTTRAYGTITARGGATGGNGGFVETSGKRYLEVGAITVNTSAPNGIGGTWLLDPANDLMVANNVDNNIIGLAGVFSPAIPSASSTLSGTSLTAAINSNSIVTVNAASGADIVFNASAGAGGSFSIDKNGNTFSSTLNLNASNIRFIGGTTPAPLTIQTLASASPLTVNLNAAGIQFVSGVTTFQANGGSVTVNNPSPGTIATAAGATVNLIGSATGQVAAIVSNPSVWTNSGTVNLATNAVVRVVDNGAGSVATFNNAATGVFTTSGITNNWFILSNSGSQAGVFNNAGTMTIGIGGGSIEGILNNLSGGTLNLAAPVGLSVQNGQTMSGTINLAAGSTMVMSENHAGVPATFGGTVIGGSGTLRVTGQIVNLNGVTAPGALLQLAGSSTTIANGTSSFSSFSRTGGTLTLNNGTLAVAGSLNVPTGVIYSGTANGYKAGTDLVAPALNTSGTFLNLTAGNDLTVSGLLTTPKLILSAGRDILLTSGLSWTASQGITMNAGRNLAVPTSSNFSTGSALSLAAGNDLTVTNATLQAQSVNLSAGRDMFIVGSPSCSVNSSTLLNLAANNDLKVINSTLQGQNIKLSAGHDMSIGGSSPSFGSSVFGQQGVALSAGRNLSTGNANFQASNGRLDATAGGAMSLQSLSSSQCIMYGSGGVSLLAGGDILLNKVTAYSDQGGAVQVVTPGQLGLRNDAHLSSFKFAPALNSNSPGVGLIGIVAGDLHVAGGSGIYTPGMLGVVASGDIVLDGNTALDNSNAGGFGHTFMYGGFGVNLDLGGTNSNLNLIGAPAVPAFLASSSVLATVPIRFRLNNAVINTDTGTIDVVFATRPSGGLTIDGSEVIGTGVFGSGFNTLPVALTNTSTPAGFNATLTPAVLGKNLFVNNLKVVIPNTDALLSSILKPVNLTQIPAPITVTREAASSDADFGTFGAEQGPQGQRRQRPGVCTKA